MFDFLFRKQGLRRELVTLRQDIELKKAKVEACDKECRRAWGKKWSHLQLQRRRQEAVSKDAAALMMADGQAEVLEIRRQQALAELRRHEQELAEMRARERALATDLGEEPNTPSEATGEKH